MYSDFDNIYDMFSDQSELSSPPTSPLTPPPSFYHSPPPSQESSFSSSQSTAASSQDQHAAPSKRKSRKAEPKPRTTRHLDLTVDEEYVDQSAKDLMLKTLRQKRKIVVVAGAGISVSAGIPDFRSSDGLFSTLKKDHKLKTSGKQLFDISVYQEESTTESFHDMLRELSTKATNAKPTDFHCLLASLAKEGRLRRLYTQNVDELDTSFPPLATEVPLNPKGPWPRTIQLHGGLKTMVCQKCRDTANLEAHRFQGPIPPLCNACEKIEEVRERKGRRSHGVGKLRPRIVLYNEHSPDEDAIGSVMTADLRVRPDALVVVGTTMKIPGVRRIVREMCRVVRGRKDGVTMWINNGSMPVGKDFEDCWDLIVKADSNEVAKEAKLKPWDDEIVDCTASEVERYMETQKPSVVINTPEKEKTYSDTGILTPSTSHDETSGSSSAVVPMETEPVLNPVSRGRAISDVLGRETNKTSAKPKARKSTAPKTKAQKKKTDAPTQDKAGRINLKFKVGKPVKPVVVKEEDPPKPMKPISPGSPRSNGPILPGTPEPSGSDTSSASSLLKDQCTISPSGRAPRGLEGCIDTGDGE